MRAQTSQNLAKKLSNTGKWLRTKHKTNGGEGVGGWGGGGGGVGGGVGGWGVGGGVGVGVGGINGNVGNIGNVTLMHMFKFYLNYTLFL